MAGARQGGKRRAASVGGLAMLAIPGFALGILAGLLWEDPGLVAAYVFGATEEVAWAPESGGDVLPDVASPPTDTPASPPPVAAAPPAKAASNPRVTPSVGAGNVAIQVGAFAERSGADRLAGQLRGKGFPVLVVPGESSGGSRWRVRVGPLDTRAEAEKTAARLKREEKLPTWIVEDDG